MIERGEFCHNGTAYDSRLSCSDFRFSMAAVGMLKFLMYKDSCDFEFLAKERIGLEDGVEYFYYNLAEVCGEQAEKDYFGFAEWYFRTYVKFYNIKRLLEREALSDEEAKELSEGLKTFDKDKYKGVSHSEALKIFQEDKLKNISKRYQSGWGMYNDFSNKKCLGKKGGNVCRLNGFYVDKQRKMKSVGFFQDKHTANVSDEPEFDYVPFAFTTSKTSYFVNNNYSLIECLKLNYRWAYNKTEGGIDEKSTRCLRMICSLKRYLQYSVEIIKLIVDDHDRKNNVFATVYLRKKALQVLKNVKVEWLDAFECPCNVSGEFINADEIVLNHIVNGIYLDDFIDRLLKDDGRQSHGALINRLLYVNMLLKNAEGENMNENIIKAKNTARVVTRKLEENKLNAYRQKLLSSIIAHDYDRFKEILLQLSVYAGVEFGFAFELFDDFEENKDAAYTFINALGRNTDREDEKIKGKEDEYNG
jgi:CRISPR-associated protein Cst1